MLARISLRGAREHVNVVYLGRLAYDQVVASGRRRQRPTTLLGDACYALVGGEGENLFGRLDTFVAQSRGKLVEESR